MVSLRRSISSLSALVTFEAAARLGSFTLAASELGVTQAAVSRQIKALEEELNAALFLRQHRKVVLTAPGQALAGTLSTAFGSVAEMIQTISRPHAAGTLTIGTTLAFSHLWVLPRLSEFRTLHPEIGLKLMADDQGVDLRRDPIDLCIRYGSPPFADGESVIRAEEMVYAVCSPALLERMGYRAETADLSKLPLIASDNVNPSWLTWKTWAEAVNFGPDMRRATQRIPLHFNHYTDSIEAALNGEGVALGWARLVQNHLASGRLIRIGGLCHRPQDAYHVVVSKKKAPSAAALVFLDWLAGHFASPTP